jgi:hypothetical protein
MPTEIKEKNAKRMENRKSRSSKISLRNRIWVFIEMGGCLGVK